MIKKVKTNTAELKKRISSNLKQMAIESIAIALVLILVAFLLSSNIIRVISTGLSNYDTFLDEKQSLAQIQVINDSLKSEYDYVNSDEFKKIILRDTLGYADSAERLYKTKERAEYFDEELIYFKLRDKTEYEDWWLLLINN